MTYDKLLKEIKYFTKREISDELWEVLEFQNGFQFRKKLEALVAVVELHKPNKTDVYEYCTTCFEIEMGDVIAARYPCKTIEAIEKIINASN